jgi:hypothetical protein
MDFSQYLKPKYFAAAAALVVALIVGLVWWGAVGEGNGHQNTLNAQFVDNENVLSDCITQIRETSGVTKYEADKFEQVLVETAKGRYEGRDNNPGQMFSAIVEDYPDMSGFDKSFERVFNVMTGCRTNYRLAQSKLVDKLKAFDDWRTTTTSGRLFGGGFPNDGLVARVGSNTDRGQEAYDKMYALVLVKDAQDAYNSGTYTPENPFGTVPTK